MSHPRDLDIRLLGPVEVVRDGQSIAVGGRQQRTLLALLAIEPGRSVPVDQLLEDLWDGEPTAGAGTTLKVSVSRLRSTLGSGATLSNIQSAYRLDLPREAVDTVRFEATLGAARQHLADQPRRAAELARSAVGLWRGRPFTDVGDSHVLRAHGQRLEELRLEAIEVAIEGELAAGRSSELVGELEALLAEHPFRERLWGHLMLALYRAGRQADALATYHRARKALAAELGIEPGPELVELQAAILRQAVPAATPPEIRHNLPTPITSFVGRTTELEALARLLADQRLVTLTGVGGVGKTRLALEAGRAAVRATTGDVWFVDLSLLADDDLVTTEVAAAVGAPEDPTRPAGERLVGHLRDREAILILDNCEHVVDACASLAKDVLEQCAAVRIVATSRVPLALSGESVVAVPPLSTAPSGTEDGRSEAAQLFLARAREASVELATAGDWAAIQRICADLDGLPLAIELAAARVRALSLEDLAGHLADRLKFLVSWRRLASARHRTLREAFDWSFDLLGHEEQTLFPMLGVFAGGFTLPAVAAVCLDGDEDRALALVERLIEASLVTLADRQSGPTRYRTLEIVREYATERLRDTGTEPEVRRRHADYFLALAEGPGDLVEQELPLEPLARLDPERRNLQEALGYFERTGQAVAALRLCAALWRFWWLRGELAEGRSNLERALARTPRERTPLRARALRGVSTLASRQGDAAAGRRFAREAVDLSRAIGDQPGLGQGLMALGNAAFDDRDLEAAARLYDDAGAIIRASANQRDLAVLLLNQSWLALEIGDIERAEPAASESLALCRAAGDDAGVAVNLTTLAVAALDRGDASRAQAFVDEALQRADNIGAIEWLMAASVVRAAVALSLGGAEQAAEDLGFAEQLRIAIGARHDGERMQAIDEQTRAAARAILGVAAFDDRFDRGRRRDLPRRLRAAAGATTQST